MRGNPIQFAVVREDPLRVAEVVGRFRPTRALLVGSGGCTALSLQRLCPQVTLTVVDPNAAQLSLIERKLGALQQPRDVRNRSFNVEDESPEGLNQCGNFESLFRGLRGFLHEHVATRAEVEAWFTPEDPRRSRLARAFSSPYWPVAFDLFFADPFLAAMFGPEATQHGDRGSYSGYFRRVFEQGLVRPDAPDNYFLHHALLGRYMARHACLPPYLADPPDRPALTLRCGVVEDQEDLGSHGLVDLSNVMDWMGDAAVARLIERLHDLEPGAVVLYRQLNNRAERERTFGSAFRFDRRFAGELLARDRSLFYESMHVGIRVGS